jgi:hypothetical protein
MKRMTIWEMFKAVPPKSERKLEAKIDKIIR